MQPGTLCVPKRNAERPLRHSHAERGNDQPTRGDTSNNREANTVIKTLDHLPHPVENAAALAGHFTDLAPPLNDRQAHLEASRCLYCYDAPCVNACPSDIDIPSFIRNIHPVSYTHLTLPTKA